MHLGKSQVDPKFQVNLCYVGETMSREEKKKKKLRAGNVIE